MQCSSACAESTERKCVLAYQAQHCQHFLDSEMDVMCAVPLMEWSEDVQNELKLQE